MRADKFFAERFGSRTKAAEALREGLVLCGKRALSPSDEIDGTEEFSFLSRKAEFVSNGGYKLARALDVFGENVEGMVFADLGASTGGFTDCLLQRGAARVFCVDVGESQLSPRLLADERVVVMDNTNARYLRPEDLPAPLDGVVCDLSFISLRLILPAVKELLPDGGRAYVLFKPQFECGRGALKKSGVCPPALHRELLSGFYDFCTALSLAPAALTNAPIRERKNVEYLFKLVRGGKAEEKQVLFRALPFPKP